MFEDDTWRTEVGRAHGWPDVAGAVENRVTWSIPGYLALDDSLVGSIDFGVTPFDLVLGTVKVKY